jgi:hypothetical protein
MNKIIIESFKNELEKNASEPSRSIGRGVSKILNWSWKHPKITLGAGVVAAFTPKIINSTFKPLIFGSEYSKHKKMNEQTQIMKDILAQEKLQNFKPKAYKPFYTKKENPLA